MKLKARFQNTAKLVRKTFDETLGSETLAKRGCIEMAIVRGISLPEV
jgi:hypothetical protein